MDTKTAPDLTPALDAQQVRAALEQSNGSVTVAAGQLGIHRAWLHKLMRRYGIEIKRIVA